MGPNKSRPLAGLRAAIDRFAPGFEAPQVVTSEMRAQAAASELVERMGQERCFAAQDLEAGDINRNIYDGIIEELDDVHSQALAVLEL